MTAPVLCPRCARLRDALRRVALSAEASSFRLHALDRISEIARSALADPDAPATYDEQVEKLAALAHEQWAGWTAWMFEKWDQTHASGESFRDRWRRQMHTMYDQLSEQEKESDRIEARKVLEALGAARPPRQEESP